MSDLQLYHHQTTASPAVLTLAHVIMSTARRASQAGRPLVPASHLGLVAADSLRTGRLHEEVLATAATTELMLRYGTMIPRITVLGATDYAIAVAFDALTLRSPTRSADPVDLLLPWACDLPYDPLQPIIEDMFSLEHYMADTGERLLRRLRNYATLLRTWQNWPDPATRALFERVTASNMTLILQLCGTRESHI